MERVTMFKTSDGAMHKTERDARIHCENQMGAIISLRGGQLVQIDKYSKTVDFLQEHLADFAKAYAWQCEMRSEIEES